MHELKLELFFRVLCIVSKVGLEVHNLLSELLKLHRTPKHYTALNVVNTAISLGRV